MPSGQLDSVLRFVRGLAAADRTLGLADRDLLERYCARCDEAAFAALIGRHGAMVLDVCRRILRHEQDAEDAFQATFLALAQKAASLLGEKSLAGWLYTVAYRAAQKAKVAAARRRGHERRAGGPADDPPSEITLREAREALDRELAVLPDGLRLPLVLCYLEGLTRDEAARRLGWPLSLLKRRLERGRERLRLRLPSHGLSLSGALAGALFCELTAAAAVPPALAASAVKAAAAVAAGTVPSPVPAAVATLADAVLRSMFLAKLKGAALALLVAATTALAACVVTSTAAHPGRHAPDAAAPAREGRAEAVKAGGASERREGDATTWRPRAALGGHADEVLCLAFGAGRLATAGKDGAIRLWDANTGKEQHRCRYPREDGPMRHMEFTPDGKHVLMTFGDQIGYWDTAQKAFPKGAIGGESPLGGTSGRDGHSLILRNKVRQHVTVLQVPRLGAVEDNKDIQLGFAAPYEFVGHFRHPAEILGAALAQDGDVLCVATADKSIHLWAVSTKKERAVCKGHTDVVLALAFSPDGRKLASAGKDGTVRLWEVATGKGLAALRGHEGPVRSAAFSPDGRTLASGGDDKTVAVWDVTAARRLAALAGHAGPVLSVAFSRDGNLIASASADKTARLWEGKR